MCIYVLSYKVTKLVVLRNKLKRGINTVPTHSRFNDPMDLVPKFPATAILTRKRYPKRMTDSHKEIATIHHHDSIIRKISRNKGKLFTQVPQLPITHCIADSIKIQLQYQKQKQHDEHQDSYAR